MLILERAGAKAKYLRIFGVLYESDNPRDLRGLYNVQYIFGGNLVWQLLDWIHLTVSIV